MRMNFVELTDGSIVNLNRINSFDKFGIDFECGYKEITEEDYKLIVKQLNDNLDLRRKYKKYE